MKLKIPSKFSSIGAKLFLCFWLIVVLTTGITRLVSEQFRTKSFIAPSHHADIEKIERINRLIKRNPPTTPQEGLSILSRRAERELLLKNMLTHEVYSSEKWQISNLQRFLIENEGREESFIPEHPNSQLEIVSTDWKPMAEIVFAKERGKERKDNLEINLEEFISVKGITALGNQLTKDKVNQVNLMDSLPYEAPEEIHADELEVIDETEVTPENSEKAKKIDAQLPASENGTSDNFDIDEEGQITLF